MNYSRFLGAVCACIFTHISSSAAATTITFNTFGSGLTGNYQEGGYIISSPPAFWISTGASFCSPECPENGTKYLMNQSTHPVFLRLQGGGAFDLFSFDYAEQHKNTPMNTAIRVSGETLTGDIVSTTLLLDRKQDGSGPLIDFQLATLPAEFRNLTSATFSPLYGEVHGFSLDNIVVAASTVPIPPAAWLFGSGLLGLISVARKKAA